MTDIMMRIEGRQAHFRPLTEAGREWLDDHFVALSGWFETDETTGEQVWREADEGFSLWHDGVMTIPWGDDPLDEETIEGAIEDGIVVRVL
jgi:hypothetical protein